MPTDQPIDPSAQPSAEPAAEPAPTPDDAPTDTPARQPTLEEIEFSGCVERHRPPIAIKGLVDPPAELPIAFDPVPRLRQRRNGWTEERQRAFIAALADCASVSRAARAVGVSARSATGCSARPARTVSRGRGIRRSPT